jgi:CheY-like chemotaxis protein
MAKILVIDDVAGVRKTIAAILRRAGHDVTEAADGSNGLAVAPTLRPDVVVTDLLMPGVDGVEVIDRLKSMGGKAPRVLAISGGGSLVGAEEALSMAQTTADATLRKPFDAAELNEAVDRLMGRVS